MLLDKSVVCPILIGRENDLQLLDRLITQAGEKSGQIALISGEAGIGKSRLIREAKVRARKGTVILNGHCFETESALPYAPFWIYLETSLQRIPAKKLPASWNPPQRSLLNCSLNGACRYDIWTYPRILTLNRKNDVYSGL